MLVTSTFLARGSPWSKWFSRWSLASSWLWFKGASWPFFVVFCLCYIFSMNGSVQTWSVFGCGIDWSRIAYLDFRTNRPSFWVKNAIPSPGLEPRRCWIIFSCSLESSCLPMRSTSFTTLSMALKFRTWHFCITLRRILGKSLPASLANFSAFKFGPRFFWMAEVEKSLGCVSNGARMSM